MSPSLLLAAALHRVSINAAADILESEGADPIAIGLVIEAIRLRNAAHGQRTAGAYWDACRDAVEAHP